MMMMPRQLRANNKIIFGLKCDTQSALCTPAPLSHSILVVNAVEMQISHNHTTFTSCKPLSRFQSNKYELYRSV